MNIPARRSQLYYVQGFTIIELLLVLAIIALLTSMLVPAVASVRDASRSVVCAGSLRQLGMATFTYMADNNGAFPDYWDPDNHYNHASYPMRFFHNLSGLTWNSLQYTDPYLDHAGVNKKKAPYFCTTNPAVPVSSGIKNWTNYAINCNLQGLRQRQITGSADKALYVESLSLVPDADYRCAGTRWSNPWMCQYPVHRQRMNLVFIDGHTQSVNVGVRSSLANVLGFWFNDLGEMQQTWFWPLP